MSEYGAVDELAGGTSLGVTVNGERDILGLWAGDGGEGCQVLARRADRDQEPRRARRAHRGLRRAEGPDRLDHHRGAVCAGASVRLAPDPQNTFPCASRKHWDELFRDLRSVYTAAAAEAAVSRLDELTAKWGGQYPAIIALWRAAWQEFITFLDYDVEIRKIICSTRSSPSAPGTAAPSGPAATSRPSSPPSRFDAPTETKPWSSLVRTKAPLLPSVHAALPYRSPLDCAVMQTL